MKCEPENSWLVEIFLIAYAEVYLTLYGMAQYEAHIDDEWKESRIDNKLNEQINKTTNPVPAWDFLLQCKLPLVAAKYKKLSRKSNNKISTRPSNLKKTTTPYHFKPKAKDSFGLELFLPSTLICFARSSSSCCFFLRMASSFCLWSSSSLRYLSSSLRSCSKAPLLCASSRSEERRVGKECRSRWSPSH